MVRKEKENIEGNEKKIKVNKLFFDISLNLLLNFIFYIKIK